MTRASRRKYHITYKTTCMITGRYYIGMHSTDTLEDGYLGSGVRLVRSVKKHGVDQHARETLAVFATRLEASEHEKMLITEEVLQDPMSLNCGAGGLGATDRPATREETRNKTSQTLKRHWADMAARQDRIATMNSVAVKQRISRACRASFQNEARLQANRDKAKKPCTVDDVTIFESLNAMILALGKGKTGTRSTNFKYIEQGA
jgi:hypothetical protein